MPREKSCKLNDSESDTELVAEESSEESSEELENTKDKIRKSNTNHRDRPKVVNGISSYSRPIGSSNNIDPHHKSSTVYTKTTDRWIAKTVSTEPNNIINEKSAHLLQEKKNVPINR